MQDRWPGGRGWVPCDPQALERLYEYHDPMHSLPEAGLEYWRSRPAATLSLLERSR